MFKELVLAGVAMISVSAFADTSSQASHEPRYDAKSFCTYENEAYSIGAKIKVDSGDTLECFKPEWGKSGTGNIKTAHWE
ncbi:DUF1496 domain-containing protein [Marinomonas spartinae]|uniref:DUF1496 domain-containing protein n=1 Tax=Marinomonas spartinae TaxID=1792290 RepID=UPI0018F1F5DE|nr:DUF1496 domain-containing protein [Marinomonas spartinae]MBJ7555408.1 DUF1496 domain-containing protein [Marinomonas spartinae]